MLSRDHLLQEQDEHTLRCFGLEVFVADLGSAVGGPFSGEVYAGELAEVFDGGVVVGTGGLDFVVEIAERILGTRILGTVTSLEMWSRQSMLSPPWFPLGQVL